MATKTAHVPVERTIVEALDTNQSMEKKHNAAGVAYWEFTKTDTWNTTTVTVMVVFGDVIIKIKRDNGQARKRTDHEVGQFAGMTVQQVGIVLDMLVLTAVDLY